MRSGSVAQLISLLRPAHVRALCRRLRPYLPNLCAAGCFLLALGVCAAMTGQWCWRPNGYNSYALQADAWLRGRLDLGQDYPWLELAIRDGRYYVSFPPFPSYVLLPFALFRGASTPDGLISLGFSLAGVWTCVQLARRLGQTDLQAVLLTLCLYLGTGYLFIALTPGVWFFAQVMCFNLCVLALFCAVTARGGLSLACWAAAVGCRPMALIYLPVLLTALWRAWHERNPRDSLASAVRKNLRWALGPLILGLSYMALNVARFGNPLEFGHNYLPEFQRVATGQFDLSYFTHNFPLLFRLPAIDPETQRLLFSPFDTYLLPLINPLSAVAVVLCLRYAFSARGRRDRGLILLILGLSAVYICFLCCHRTLGGWQFGNRYMKDVMPFVFYALLLSAPTDARPFRALILPLLVGSAALHLTGTILTWNYWW